MVQSCVCGTPADEVTKVGTMPCSSEFASPAAWFTGWTAPAGGFVSTVDRYIILAAIWNREERKDSAGGEGRGGGLIDHWVHWIDCLALCYLEFFWAKTAECSILVKNDSKYWIKQNQTESDENQTENESRFYHSIFWFYQRLLEHVYNLRPLWMKLRQSQHIATLHFSSVLRCFEVEYDIS